MSLRNIIATVISAFIAGVIALLGTIYFADLNNVGAQTQAVPAPRPPASQHPVAQASPAAPVRTETINYDAWTVTCRDTADGKTKKICSAMLPFVVEQQNRRINVGAWIIAYNPEGALFSMVQTPQIDVGVLLSKGVDLKLANGQPHKTSFVDCNPQHCEAALPMDEAFLKETLAGANGPAVITFWKTDGAEFYINIPSIKGVDRAIAAVR